MADAYECDRCGSFESGEPTATIKQTLKGDMGVCTPCAKDFHRWADNKPVNPLENAMKMGEMHD